MNKGDLALFRMLFLRGLKRGISTIIATVLIVLVTVAAVTILWIGVAPLLTLDVTAYDARLSIVLEDGYTFYDSEDKSVTVQLESTGSDTPDYVQIILTLADGSDLISYHDAPLHNSRSVYYFAIGINNSNPPISVSVAPIFVVDGRNILGKRGKAITLPQRIESDRDSTVVRLNPTKDHSSGGNDFVSEFGGGSGSSGGGDCSVNGDADCFGGQVCNAVTTLCEDIIAGTCINFDNDTYDMCDFDGLELVSGSRYSGYDSYAQLDCDDGNNSLYPGLGCCIDADVDGYDVCNLFGDDGSGFPPSPFSVYDGFLRDCDDTTYDASGGFGVAYGCCVDYDRDGFDACGLDGYDVNLDYYQTVDFNQIDCVDNDLATYPGFGCCIDFDGDGYDVCNLFGDDGSGSPFSSYSDTFLRDCDDSFFDNLGGQGVAYDCCIDNDQDGYDACDLVGLNIFDLNSYFGYDGNIEDCDDLDPFVFPGSGCV